MTTLSRLSLSFLVLALAAAPSCTRVYNSPTGPTTTYQATPSPAPVSADLIEFRADGDLRSAVIRMSNSLDGLTQVTTVLPYSTRITLTGQTSAFISLEVQGSGLGFVHAAIFVNGVLFREASSATAFNPLISVSGTWRK